MSHFTALNKEISLHQTQIFLRLFSFSNLLRKVFFLFISELLSEIVTFWNKKRSFSKFPQKWFNTTEKHSIDVCGSFWGEKKFLLIFVAIYRFDQNQFFKQSKLSSGFFPFQTYKKNKLSEYFRATIWDSHLFNYKEKFWVNFTKKNSKQQESIV